MSAIAHPAHYDRRPYHELAAQYDSAATSAAFAYTPAAVSLNAVTASAYSLEGSYALNTPSPSSAYVWDSHHSVQSPSYPTSSSPSLATSYSPSSPSALPGPPPVSSFSSDYPSPPRAPVPATTSSRAVPAAAYHISPAPASPPRPSYASGSRSYSSLAAANVSPSSPPPPAARLQNAHWEDSSLYTIEPSDSVSSPSSAPDQLPHSPPIKEEDPEGGFIIEVSVPAEQPITSPMPEVPLRATHAPPKMRKMMYSFRLENFAMHDGIRSAATQPGSGGIEVGPLREKPVELEWQVDLDEPLVPQDELLPHYGSASAKPSPSSRTSVLYRASPSSSPQLSTRSMYASPSSPSPSLNLEYPPSVDDSWDASSAYSSVTNSGSGSTTGATGSPSFTSVMTPAQSLSLGWNPRYQNTAVELDASAYRRPSASQNSLSRVSQTHGQYLMSGGNKSPYQSTSQYGFDSAGFSRANVSSSRFMEGYAAQSSTSGWYRSS